MKTLLALLLLLLLAPLAQAQEPNPTKGTFVLTNARIETISNGTIERGTLIIRDGKIDTLGTNISVPQDADEVIDCNGLTLYPGLINSGTNIGLVEVGSLPETRDTGELGDITPHMKVLTAINPNSVVIPTTRVSGVTTVLTNPSSGMLPGTSALINLVGYTPQQMSAGFSGMVLNFPTTGRRGRFDRRSEKEIKKASDKALKTLNDTWDDAVLFARIDSAHTANPDPNRAPAYVPEMQALIPVIRGEMPLLLEVNAAKDIQAALKWVKDRNVKAIFTGVSEGWRVADEIAGAGIPCIVGPILSLPTRGSDRYDKAYANAGLLHKAGVKVALRTRDTANARNLPYHAGFSATYGMGREAALKAVTQIPAEIFGLSDQLGTLEPGKNATLFAANGDPFETQTDVLHVFIDGYRIPQTDRQRRLYEEFLARTPGLGK